MDSAPLQWQPSLFYKIRTANFLNHRERFHSMVRYSLAAKLWNLVLLVMVLTIILLLLSGCGGRSRNNVNNMNVSGERSNSGNFNGQLDTTVGTGVYKIGNPYQIQGEWYKPIEDFNYEEEGIASWYGPGFHGKKTANGEIFDTNSLSAAHRTLQMPCFVRVTNLDNNRSVIVRVNDRGPFVKTHNRIIDLSQRAAQLLGFISSGTARVKVQIMGKESKTLADYMKSKKSGSLDDALTLALVSELSPFAIIRQNEIARQNTNQLSGAKVFSIDLYNASFH